MQIFRSMETSTSALTAERLRMDIIANNLANINTTRGPNGQPYRRQIAVQAERKDSFQDVFTQVLAQDSSAFGTSTGNAGNSFAAATTADASGIGQGVRITQIQEDQSPFKEVYDPTNPDADANGMVRMPNVDMTTEMVDMMTAQRVYEANVSAFNASKAMALKALEIGR